ncbi:hypothetical protein [Escherichia coli]|uniref:hypothetical protein n=1 Tax=Escherichia coli TaxID=562 RepID=UPI00069B3AD7|nr:hypothetical protein [Escherichia coli]EFH3410618.1 hypothetical protein [Escherichia coli]EFH3509599.1 hypothetical protein [Escherichia coli]EGH1358771.1 DUF551 domain-containing protein [Escherichia coli]EGM8545136.1 DUF551 domain-containing protein [Escherichia coli]EJR8421231.1 hypothetical protein [Escherichia coli]
MIRTLVIDFAKAPQEPSYHFNADILGGRLLRVVFKDALASPWIATDAQLPGDYDLVLVCDGYGVETANYIDGEFHCTSETYPAKQITHWMLVPELPEGC